MTNIESLRLITEAVETAGADIAPSYAEYVQLAFAIATDCGEAGREFFHRLCRISAKYQREHAERMFSNALMKQHGEIHLGTAFHLAESTGVKICREEVMNSRKNAENALNAPYNFPTHTGARIIRWKRKKTTTTKTPMLQKNSRQTVILYNPCLLSPKQTGLKS